jgi:hypothetical protein
MNPSRVINTMCFACGHHLAVPFFYGQKQPLATIAWPKSKQEAQEMKRLNVDFVRCVACGHIYNASFNYADVPYSDKPNLMFNQGAAWADFIREQQQEMVGSVSDTATIVEIGHGDGSFIAALSRLKPAATCIGFDPHGATRGNERVTLHPELFEAEHHMQVLRPNLIITRHVLEHLTHPLAFLQQLNFFAGLYGLDCAAYFEVPCVDRVIETGRTVDLYYEHSSQFTTSSFSTMLEKAGVHVIRQGYGYDGEVIFALVKLTGSEAQYHVAHQAEQFSHSANEAHRHVRGQLDELNKSGKKIAVWGGTGKSAAFMNFYELDARIFPLVVDSDPAKVGTFVPGQGQEIQFRDVLKTNPVDVIIIPPQWRARDILLEMRKHGITAKQILIEHEGRLIDFVRDPHPYRMMEGS